MIELELAGYRIRVRPGGSSAPILYLNLYEDCAAELAAALPEDLNLVAVSGLNWERDLSPWPTPAVFKGGADFPGGAGAYLKWWSDDLVPTVEARLGTAAVQRFLAGYSLAGLFALWTLHNSALFAGAGSFSGSLWYPGWLDYVRKTPLALRPQQVVLSLGDRESRSRHPLLSQTAACTAEYVRWLGAQGIPALYASNPGGHQHQVRARVIAGLRALLGLTPSPGLSGA